jgi:Flp pilus assembly protein TadG
MIRPFRKRARRILHDERGSHIVEFAVVAPVLLTMMMALFDITYRQYAIVMLQGALQKAARDGALESGGGVGADTALDAAVRDNFKRINSNLPNSAFTFTRRNFMNFTNAGEMEPSTGPSGRCAPPAGMTTYTYVDTNNSSSWDDGALSGSGGASDVISYTVRVEFPNMFPVTGLLGWSDRTVMSATTLLRNQPYNLQAARTAGPTRNCPVTSPYYP